MELYTNCYVGTGFLCRMKEKRTMNEKETIEHEIIKNAIKMGIVNNSGLTNNQKKQAMDNVDRAAQQADWFVELLRQCGYIR